MALPLQNPALAFKFLKKIFKEFAVFTGFWPKYHLEMKVKVKSRIGILLHVLRQSFMQKRAL
jgi:hypothetical protein